MKYLLLSLLALAFVDISFGYCTLKREPAGSTECTAHGGVKVAGGATLHIKAECMSCTCLEPLVPDARMVLSCCGYGIHGGVMMAPSGCKIVADTDGCTPKMVKIFNETQPCSGP